MSPFNRITSISIHMGCKGKKKYTAYVYRPFVDKVNIYNFNPSSAIAAALERMARNNLDYKVADICLVQSPVIEIQPKRF